jgi:hypothetical protein
MKTKFSFSLLFFACPFHHFPVSLKFATHCPVNLIGGVMVSVLASTAVDLVFETRSGQTKDCKIGVCCFSAKQATYATDEVDRTMGGELQRERKVMERTRKK